MKRLFYIGLILLGLFEFLNVYLIMPMPGSQRLESVNLAYFLYSYRWFFRIVFLLLISFGGLSAFNTKIKWIPASAALLVAAIVYFFNFQMSADHMFLQPQNLAFASRTENTLNDSSVVLAVSIQGESKAYPVRYIQYHHQVRDTIAGEEIMVTYCNVCRTGRVFRPMVDGKPENFRLVGMDHFNAMFEDRTTKSWWRQATGEAIAGPLKGKMLPEFPSAQLTLGKFFTLYPFGKVMQAEDRAKQKYDSLGRFEQGRSESHLTRTDSLSWQEKSWVLGVELHGNSKAYDWLQLRHSRIINDSVGTTPIVIALASDQRSFAVYERNSQGEFIIRNDSLISADGKYDFAGRSSGGNNLQPVQAYQEFWHSWKEFHPNTTIYK